MSEDRLILAIGRLERALARVESAAQKSPASASLADHETQNDSQMAWNALSSRHDRLKQQVEGAIAALDGIIAKG